MAAGEWGAGHLFRGFDGSPKLTRFLQATAPWAFGGTLLLGVIIRLKGIDNPFLDFHGWRQCDTGAVARYFFEREMNILRPQLPYYGAPPNYAELEFGLVPYIVAWLYGIFGETHWIARSVIVGFSLWAIVSVNRVAQTLWGTWPGLAAAFTLAVHPVYVYFSRSLQPDVPMLALGLAAIANFLVWGKTGSRIHAFIGCLWFTLAVLVKPPAWAFAFPLLIWWLKTQRKKVVVGLAYIAAPLIASFSYFQAIHGIAEHPFVSGLTMGFAARLWQEGIGLRWFSDVGRGLFFYAITPFFFVPVLIGCMRSLFSRERVWIGAWMMGLMAFFLLAGSKVLNNLQYYYLLAVPLAALLSGAAFSSAQKSLINYSRSWVLGILLLVTTGGTYMLIETYQQWLPERWLLNEPWSYERWYILDEKPLRVGQAIERITPEDALVVVVEDTPRTLFYSRRFGWFIEPAGLNEEYLTDVRREGAQYLAWMEKTPPSVGKTAQWHEEGFWLVSLNE